MKEATRNFSFVITIAFSAFAISVLANSARADITVFEDVDPAYDGISDPWNIFPGDLKVGITSDGSMRISSPSTVADSNGYVGYDTDGTGTVTVTGTASLWDNSQNVYIGWHGQGELLISYRGKVSNDLGYIGRYEDSVGSVNVSGWDSLWENSGGLYIGYAGDGEMVISNAGDVTSSMGYIGHDPNGTGHVTVTDYGSLWQNTGDLYVGRSGGGWLEISYGGTVSTTNSDSYVAYDPNSYGLVTVNGDDARWQNSGDLCVGYSGDADMVISNGGSVTNSFGYIGCDPNAAGRVTVVGSDSLWENSASLFVGVQGQGELTVSDDGRVESSDGFVGCSELDWYSGLSGPNDMSFGGAPSSVGRASVTGQGSLWQNLDQFGVGCEGGDGQLSVSDGGVITGSRGFVGCFDPELVALAELGHIPWVGDANSIGRVAVTDPNSLWVSGTAFVGCWGGQGELTISDGGTMISPVSLIGGFGSNALALLDPNYAGLGIDVNSVGYAAVTGPNSVLESSDALFIGGLGGQGELTISDAGKVTSSYGLIGGFDPVLIGADPNDYPVGVDANSVGLVTVTGPNSLWDNSNDLYVGGSTTGPGGTGLLEISNGGMVQADKVTVWETGTIGGDGTLTAGTMHNYGTLTPGNSIGTLTVDGDVTMEPNSVFEVEVDNSGNSDKLIVTGEATIGGGVVKAISTETITGWHEYTIMEANGVTGTFAALDTALLQTGIVDPLAQLGYEIDSVLLRIMAAHFDDPNIARTHNQRAVGSALQQIADGGGNSITTAVQGLSSNGQVRATYDQLCGSPRPPLSAITVADTAKFMGTVSNRMHCARTGISYGATSGPLFAMARPDNTLGSGRTYDVSPRNYMFALGNGSQHFGDQDWGIWGKAYGLYGDRENESGMPGYVYKLWGWSVGHDCRLTDELLVGVTGGFSEGYVDYATPDRSDVDSSHIGVYSSYNSDGWYLDSVLTYGWASYETKRLVSLMGEKLEGDFDGREITGYFEGGLDWYTRGGWLVQPLASFQVSYLDLDGYTETGGASALGYDDQDFRSYKGALGIRIAEEVVGGDNGLSFGGEVRARWVHEFGDTTSSVDAHFGSDPGTVFAVSDGDASRDSAVLGVGFHAELSEQMRLYFDYDASVSGDNVIHVVSGALEYRW